MSGFGIWNKAHTIKEYNLESFKATYPGAKHGSKLSKWAQHLHIEGEREKGGRGGHGCRRLLRMQNKFGYGKFGSENTNPLFFLRFFHEIFDPLEAQFLLPRLVLARPILPLLVIPWRRRQRLRVPLIGPGRPLCVVYIHLLILSLPPLYLFDGLDFIWIKSFRNLIQWLCLKF